MKKCIYLFISVLGKIPPNPEKSLLGKFSPCKFPLQKFPPQERSSSITHALEKFPSLRKFPLGEISPNTNNDSLCSPISFTLH